MTDPALAIAFLVTGLAVALVGTVTALLDTTRGPVWKLSLLVALFGMVLAAVALVVLGSTA